MPSTRQSASVAASGMPSSSEAPLLQPTARTESPPAAAMAAKPNFTNPKAEILYEMLEAQSSSATQTFTQPDLLALSITDSAEELMHICQELGNLGLFQLLTIDGQACWRLKSQSDASKVQSLDSDARIIYNTIEAAGTAGIWTKTLKGKTNLHQTVMTRSLKSLESKGYVKQVRNAKFPGRKIYMLKNLNPTDDVTGGPWYSDGELDQDLINIISDVVVMYVENKSWRVGPKLKSLSIDSREAYPMQHMLTESGRILLPHPPGYKDYPVASELLTFLDSKGIVSDKNIHLADFQILLDILVFDRKLEVVGSPSGSASRSWRNKGKVDRRKRKLRRAGKPTTTFAADDQDINPRAGKRRKVFNFSGTPSSPPPHSASEEEDDDDEEEDPDTAEPESMYRSVRRTGYPPPSAHDHPAIASNSTAPTDDPSATTIPATIPTTSPAKDKDKEKPNTKPKSKDKDKPKSKSRSKARPAERPRDRARPRGKDDRGKPRTQTHTSVPALLRRNSAFADTPCARCPMFRLCEPGGLVDAESCGYFGPWFELELAGAEWAGVDVDEIDFTTAAATGAAAVTVEI